jgi:DNA-binding IclR family transcriptional regulator
MGTIAKALQLLTYFSSDIPEIGLSQFVQLTGDDKATLHRRLGELRQSGFLHQDPVSRAYRLGPAISRLEIVKEMTFPARRVAMDEIRQLNQKVRETVHVSVIQGNQGLSTLAHIDDPSHGIRVYMDANELLPFHATASGLVVLAHMENDRVEKILKRGLPEFTDDTQTNIVRVRNLLIDIRKAGFARSQGGFETDVVGLAVPLFDHRQDCAGAVAVAAPASRMDAARQQTILPLLKSAAAGISTAWNRPFS